MIKLFAGLAILSASLTVTGGTGLAQPTVVVPTSPAQIPSPVAKELTGADVEAYFDGMIPAMLKTARVPGAMIVIVKDGKVLFEKGYGYADDAPRIPVDPQRTLFRPGSISKLFTWTAVMQLVEQGEIDLDRDINTYLDFKIPPRSGQPVTMRQIMKHLGGFEEAGKNLIAVDIAAPSLAHAVKSYTPERIYDAGSMPAYSNYATGLAGYVVQRVSHEDFDSYIERHIFKPLNMRHSTFRQPLPTALKSAVSKGWDSLDGPSKGFEIVSLSPAGALSATGDDMAKFMLAHLQNGELGGKRILRPQTAMLMHSSITRNYPGINGFALGFYEQNLNGHRVIGHAGDTFYFHSQLSLFLNDNVGFYFSVNARGKDALGAIMRQTLLEGFADRYFPAPSPVVRVDRATALAHARLVAGRYVSSRRTESNFLSLGDLASPITISSRPDGSIKLEVSGRQSEFTEIAPFLWSEIYGHNQLSAVVSGGRVLRIGTGTGGFSAAFLRPTLWQSASWQLPALSVALALLAITIGAWPAAALARRHYQKPSGLTGINRWIHHLLPIAAITTLAGAFSWALVLEQLGSPVIASDAKIYLAAMLSIIGVIGGFFIALSYVVVGFRQAISPVLQVARLALAASFVFLALFCFAHHLFSFNTSF